MLLRNLRCVSVFACLLAISCLGSAPRSLDDLLRERHVDLTKEGLLTALKSTDAEVRGLAASKLAADRAEAAIPAMMEAFAAERVPETRLNIAFALAQLGNEAGSTGLTRACNDPGLPVYLRERATAYMLQLGREDCLNAVLEMLQSDADPRLSRTTVLSLVPQFRHASKEDHDKILGLVVRCLADETPAVRIEAGAALRALRDPASIAYLQGAIANEHDDVVRSRLQDAVLALQREGVKASPK